MSKNKILEVKQKTNVNIGAAKRALLKTDYNIDAAVSLIKEEGMRIARQRRFKITQFSGLGSYLHSNQKVGALVEVACESESTVNSEYFKELCNNIAKQVAASGCVYISKDDVPNELSIKIDSRDELSTFIQEKCLLEQQYLKNDKLTVDEFMLEFIYTHQENIEIKRFIRYEV